MRETNSKTSPWRTANFVVALSLGVISLLAYGNKMPIRGWVAWPVAALVLSLLAEGLYSGEIGFSINWLPIEVSRDSQPFVYWSIVGLYFLVLLVVINLAHWRSA